MKRLTTRLTILAAVLGAALCAPLGAADFSGKQALEYTRQATALGPRPSGSAANKKLQALIVQQLKANGWAVVEDAFTARTPDGVVQMKNIIAHRPGLSGRAVAVTGHFDTKKFPFPFVGANDGGSSTGLVLELARCLKDVSLRNDVYLVFFDGEEAVREWSDTDSLYGSRHLADRWAKDGTNAKLKALINVDMIGDKDLLLVHEEYSVGSLRELVWDTGHRLGYGKHLADDPEAVQDDHVPFLKKGVPALDLIDFTYGPNQAYWHTEKDTMDKLSAESLQIVGSLVVATLKRLEP